MAGPKMFHRVLIANRGEVAVRVARTCEALGIAPVFAVSDADKDATYVQGRETVHIGAARASESYLAPMKLVRAAIETHCTAVHPGWGFLAENAAFATLCETHGVTFIGPPAHVMDLMGRKSPAKRAMTEAGLHLIPGSDGPVEDAAEATKVADAIGYPVLFKAEAGGGGRGMRVARSTAEVASAYAEAVGEARAAFGNPRVFVEKLIEAGRHIEIQILADKYESAVHLGERDCTVQRNHQKLIEESNAPTLSAEVRETTLSLAVEAARRIGYVGAGTMEFLLDSAGVLRFMEMNTRLQVEHPVSEMRSGVDLVEHQIRVAAGQPLSITQHDIELSGHAIECRINAEDPSASFKPSPGVITEFRSPTGLGVRVDTHAGEGYEVPPFYDSLVAKVITYGDDREQARTRMLSALGSFEIDGISTTIPMHQAILSSQDFIDNDYTTAAIPGWEQS